MVSIAIPTCCVVWSLLARMVLLDLHLRVRSPVLLGIRLDRGRKNRLLGNGEDLNLLRVRVFALHREYCISTLAVADR